MKKYLLLFCVNCLVICLASAQERVTGLFREPDLSEKKTLSAKSNELINRLKSAKILTLDRSKSSQLFKDGKNYRLQLPTDEASLELELKEANVLGPAFKVVNAGGNSIPVDIPAFYWGKVVGAEKSFVTLTVSQNEVSGIITSDKFNYTLGKIKDSDLHIIYTTNELPIEKSVEDYCKTVEVSTDSLKQHSPQDKKGRKAGTETITGCRAIEIYFETDHQTYLDLGSSIPAVVNYVANLFSNVAQLYANEGVNIVLNSLKVWDTVDPYAGATNASNVFYLFCDIDFSPTGAHLAHLLSTRKLGGGLAGMIAGNPVYEGMIERAVFMECSRQSAFALSTSLAPALENVPNYSWNVNVVAHELGHNFGLSHTHSCNWPGGAIDNCGMSANYVEGVCNVPNQFPENGGTIMSYCHLHAAVGVNFLKGFGEMPGDKLRAEVAAANCLGGAVALVPEASSVNVCGPTSVTLSAAGCSGTYRWYDSPIGGTLLSSSPNFTTPILTYTTTYYVDCSITSNCSSKRKNVEVFIGAPEPVTLNGNGCGDYTSVTLYSTGCESGTLQWYNSAIGGSAIGTGNMFTTPLIDTTTTYFVSCSLGSCVSNRIPAIAFITATNCPCIPNSHSCSSINITQLRIYNEGNVIYKGVFGCGSGAYKLYTYPIPLINRDKDFNIEVVNQYGAYLPHGAKAWIDYNRNGVFEGSEEIFSSGISQWVVAYGNFHVPLSAALGHTIMRIRIGQNVLPEPCNDLYYGGNNLGQTLDYIVNITDKCPDILNLVSPNDNLFYDGQVSLKTSILINASNLIFSPVKVVYQSPTIDLQDGFDAKEGTVFTAEPGGCNN